MLSRVADSIYWMSRYIERAENVARVVDVTLNLILDMPVGSVQQWQPLVETTGDTEAFARRIEQLLQNKDLARELGRRARLSVQRLEIGRQLGRGLTHAFMVAASPTCDTGRL